MTFEKKVARLREFGAVTIRDWFPGDAAPYRSANLELLNVDADRAALLAPSLTATAFAIDGYLTISGRTGSISLHVMRPLTEDEIVTDPPVGGVDELPIRRVAGMEAGR